VSSSEKYPYEKRDITLAYLRTSPQEVDHSEKLIPVLEEANYGHVYAAGPRKRHGCLIGFRKDSLAIRDQFVLHYDDIDIRADGTELSRKGLSFRTKNIANVVILERLGQPSEGYIVATTHLFWHPSSVQPGLIKRGHSNANFRFTLHFRPGMRMNEPGMRYCSMYSTTTVRSVLRQAGILLREVVKYREISGLLSWPCFLAGGKSHIHLMLPEPFP